MKLLNAASVLIVVGTITMFALFKIAEAIIVDQRVQYVGRSFGGFYEAYLIERRSGIPTDYTTFLNIRNTRLPVIFFMWREQNVFKFEGTLDEIHVAWTEPFEVRVEYLDSEIVWQVIKWGSLRIIYCEREVVSELGSSASCPP